MRFAISARILSSASVCSDLVIWRFPYRSATHTFYIAPVAAFFKISLRSIDSIPDRAQPIYIAKNVKNHDLRHAVAQPVAAQKRVVFSRQQRARRGLFAFSFAGDLCQTGNVAGRGFVFGDGPPGGAVCGGARAWKIQNRLKQKQHRQCEICVMFLKQNQIHTIQMPLVMRACRSRP